MEAEQQVAAENNDLWKNNSIYSYALSNTENFSRAVQNAFFVNPSGPNPEAESFKKMLAEKYPNNNTPQQYLEAFANKEKMGDENIGKAKTVAAEARASGDEEQQQSAQAAERLLAQQGDAWTNPELSMPVMMIPESATVNQLQLRNQYLQMVEQMSESPRKDFVRRAVMDLGNTSKQAIYWKALQKEGFIDGLQTPTCACAVACWKNGEGTCSPLAKDYLKNGTIPESQAQIGDFVVYDRDGDTSKNGKGHIGIYMGNGKVLSENLAYLGKYYAGPIIHNINDYTDMTNPRFVKFG